MTTRADRFISSELGGFVFDGDEPEPGAAARKEQEGLTGSRDKQQKRTDAEGWEEVPRDEKGLWTSSGGDTSAGTDAGIGVHRPGGKGGGSSSGDWKSAEGARAAVSPVREKADKFKAAFDSAFKDSPFKHHVSHYGVEDLGKMSCVMSPDGKAGVAVKDHGDGRIEATALFNQGGQKGIGVELLRHVVDNYGVNYVECYGPTLNKLYEKVGFKEATRDAFNSEYAATDWDYDRFDHPDYVTMRLEKTRTDAKPGVSDTEKRARDEFLDELAANPRKYKGQWLAEAKRENPKLTDKQLEWAWRQLAAQFGLEAGEERTDADEWEGVPRDEEGRWTSIGSGSGGSDREGPPGPGLHKVGGRGGSGGPAGDFSSTHDKVPPSAQKQPAPAKDEPLKPGRTWVGTENPDGSWSGQLMGKSNETWKDHYDKHPDEGGKPSPERAAFHERELIAPAFDGKKTAGELGEKPIAILTMGGPASGKGVVLGKLAKHGLDTSRFVHVDPDEVKSQLPEYKASVPKDPSAGPTFRGAAAQVHEESSAVAKQIRDRAVDRGHHVIIDGTGGNADKFIALMNHLEAKGYDVHVHHPDLNPDEGVRRAASRAEGSGRYVPEHVIRGTYAKIEKARDKIHAAAPNLTVYDAANGHKVKLQRKRGG